MTGDSRSQPKGDELRNVVAGRERQISPDEAKEIALRLIAGAFGRADLDKRPRFSIPCKPWDDDDCLIIEFIKQSTTLTARVEVENDRRADRIEDLEKALFRQTDNMAFVVNRCSLGPNWYDKFSRELAEDRAVLQPKGAAV